MRESTTEKLVRQLDWNLLYTFLVIVQEGGITNASKRLLLQQPTVSLALKRLETRLNERLIERRTGVFRLTPPGELLYGECVRIYGSVSRLAVAIRDSRDVVTGHVQIALASHIASSIIDDVLANFHLQNPRVTYSISVGKSSDTTGALLGQQESLGIILVNKPNPELEYLHMYREYFGFFCGPTHRLFGQKGLQITDLKGEPTVSFSADILSDVLRPLALFREDMGFDSHIVGTSTHLEEVRRMIVVGLGIGPLPIHVAQRNVDDGLLWQLPPYGSPVPMDVYLAWNPETRLDRAERLMLSAFKEAIGKLPIEARTYPARFAGHADT